MRRKTREVTDEDERLHGLQLICEHCGFPDTPLETCLGLNAVRVYRIDFNQLTCKRNLPGSNA